MVKDGKGQPAQPSNSKEIEPSGYNGQCFVNGTCSDGHLLRATSAENLQVHTGCLIVKWEILNGSEGYLEGLRIFLNYGS